MKNFKLLITLFVALLALLFAEQYLASSTQTVPMQWAFANTNENPSLDDWQEGNVASAGFSDKTLHFQLDVGAAKQHFVPVSLTVWPTYLDAVEVVFFAENGQQISQIIKGDKKGDPRLSYARDVDQYQFGVPIEADSAYIRINSTSSLRAVVNVHSEDQAYTDLIKRLMVKVATFTFIVVAAILATMIWWSSRSSIYIYFVVYLCGWMVLLLTFSNILVVIDSRMLVFNGKMVSWGSILTSVAGMAFFYKIISLMIKPNLFLRFLGVMTLLAAVNFVLYLFIDERLGLSMNMVVVSFTSFVLLLCLPLIKGKSHLASYVIKKTRLPFALLLLFVLVSSAAGLGQGSIYSLNFVHAILTVMFNAYFIWLWFNIERRQNANAMVKSRALGLTNDQLNKQIEEQNTLFAMLFHEIKTPLTSLKFILYGWAKKAEADVQIDHIRHVLEQVEMMQMVDRPQQPMQVIGVTDVVEENWQQLLKQQHHGAELQLRQRGDSRVPTNEFLLQTIVKNLIDNSVKYGVGGQVKVFVYRHKERCFLRIKNRLPEGMHVNVEQVLAKYWRQASHVGVRGTGLGLWIVDKLCVEAGIRLEIVNKNGQFEVTLEIPCLNQ